ncbi:MAG: uroporphyrinogen-III synthase, partial [Halocynthiibacter sp.]
GGTGQALIQHIKNHATPCGLHYIQGTTRRVDIARALAPLGYDVKNHVAYRQTPLSLSNEARRIVSGDQSCFLPLFSPQTAALLKKELSDVTKNALFIAISDATAKELGPQTDPIFTCPDPTADAVLDMIGALLMGKLPLAGYGGE